MTIEQSVLLFVCSLAVGAAVAYLLYKLVPYVADRVSNPHDVEQPQTEHLKHVYGDEPEYAVKQWKAYKCRVCGILSYRKRNKTPKEVEL